MKRVLSLLLVTALSPTLALASPTVRMSWDTCDPATYDAGCCKISYDLVISGAGIPPGTYDSYEMRLWLVPGLGYPLQDAWRFDAGGCQAGMLSVTTAAFSKGCPALAQGTFTSTSTIDYALSTDPPNSLTLQLNVSGGPFTVAAGTRYTLWQIKLDTAFSIAGPSHDGYCGGAEQPLCVVSPHVTLFSGSTATPLTSDYYLTSMNASGWVFDSRYGCIYYDPTQTTTWGRIKGTYR